MAKKTRGQGRPAHYPWDRWLLVRKKPFRLRKKEFSSSQRSMAVMFRNQARLRGVRVSVHRLKDGGLYIVPRGGEE